MNIKLPNHPLLRPELLPRYRTPVMGLLSILFILAVAVLFNQIREDERQQRYAATQQRLKEARQIEQLAVNARENIRRYGATYQALHASRKVSGEEDRLRLLEALTLYSQLPQFQSITFNVGAQKPSTLILPHALNSRQLKASTTELKFKTHNHQSLAALLRGMRHLPGLLYPHQCILVDQRHQPNNNNAPDLNPYPLDVECQLVWLTFSEHNNNH